MINLKDDKHYTSLAGKLLVASPYCQLNEMFNKSIVYILSHSVRGAIGVIINRLINNVPINKIVDILKHNEKLEVSDNPEGFISLYIGGPIEPEKGLVLHSSEYDKNALFGHLGDFGISYNLDVLKDLLINKGPQKSLFIMGYTLWEPGQLEKELQSNLWLIANSNKDIIFMENNDLKWSAAINSLGLNYPLFTTQIGHG